MLIDILIIIFKIFLIIFPLLISIAYLTFFERKVIGSMQLRKGPNVVGPFGLLQPIADGLKLLSKETIFPDDSNKFLFILSPIITFVLALIAWAVIPIDYKVVLADINVGIMYIFAVSSLGVYGIIVAGWSSNSRYAFLGSLRSAAQMISYEVSIGLIIISILLTAGSLNLSTIVLSQEKVWYIIPHFPMFVIFFISTLAETNRAPFDLPEAESELVAGYNVEYSSMSFGLFFLGEYGAKVAFLLFIFLWVRATLPRYRYDQLMSLGWKLFLPLSLFWIIVTSCVIFWMRGNF